MIVDSGPTQQVILRISLLRPWALRGLARPCLAVRSHIDVSMPIATPGETVNYVDMPNPDITIDGTAPVFPVISGFPSLMSTWLM